MTNKTVAEKSFLRRIHAVKSGQQIIEMSADSISILTNDFEERWVRMLITKCDAPSDQLEVLETLERDFYEAHCVGYDFDVAEYDRELPGFFKQLRLDIELGLPITADDSILDVSEVDDTPEAWIAACKDVSSVLTSDSSKLDNALHQISDTVKESISQIGALRKGMMQSMLKKLAQCQNEIKTLRAENERLKAARLVSKTAEDDPFSRTVTYENVVNHIARRDIHDKREELISMFEALLPKNMHEKFRDDVNDKVEVQEAKRRAKRRASTQLEQPFTPHVNAAAGSTVNIIQGTNINHAEKVER